MMQDCWNLDPGGRPTFRALLARLEATRAEPKAKEAIEEALTTFYSGKPMWQPEVSSLSNKK